jgi:sortase A
MVRRVLVAGFCLLAVTCGGGAPQASSRMVERTSMPAVDAGGAPNGLLASLTPVRLVIPRIAVDARIEPRGLDPNRNLDVPADYRDVAWYNLGPAPGQPGNAILNGHVNWWTGAAVFTRLSELRNGDRIKVVRGDGSTLTFKVTKTTVVLATARVAPLFASSPTAGLTLITCSGEWDTELGSDTHRLLVSAVLV